MAVVAAVFVAAALVACSDGDASTPGATVPEALPETTTTTIDVTVVPDEITVAYADAVMDELDSLLGEAIRELVRARGPNERFYNLLNAVYDEPSFENKQSVYGMEAAEGLSIFRSEPEDPATAVQQVIRDRNGCVLLAVDRDFSPALASPNDEPTDAYVALHLKAPDSDPAGLNPTPWTVVFDGDTRSGEPPSTPCA